MYTNVITYDNNVVLVVDGSFDDMRKKMERYFGPCTGWNIASGRGELRFGDKSFHWTAIEKDILMWDSLKWGGL